MEAAVGILFLALVVTALCTFAQIIRRSLDMHAELRAKAGTSAREQNVETFITAEEHDVVAVDALGEQYIFGADEAKVVLKVAMPGMKIP